jgi:hypothetical protein
MINDDTLKEGPEAAELDYDNMSEEEVTKRMQAGIAGLLANLEQSVCGLITLPRNDLDADTEFFATARAASSVRRDV